MSSCFIEKQEDFKQKSYLSKTTFDLNVLEIFRYKNSITKTQYI
ncbi:hypothetical protein J2T04_002276 [Chryseobacterium lathyri]|uniref:Lipoprotein n=1 Tax=Chryseobacterium lathyri TaxID=395933 RepID=A0ABT9SLS8_9FLAO|nr:hypothetical protein [Chryseobacterium lathyri]